MASPLPTPENPVMSTMRQDGSRRWMQPRGSHGRFWKARLAVAVALIATFTVLPWVRINGKPPLLLDVMLRQFTFFGTTFRPTETLFLALVVPSAICGLIVLYLGRRSVS